MFYKKTDSGYKNPMEGVELKALAWGDRTMLCEFRIKAGRSVPEHDHPHEQTGYLVKGKMRLFINEESMEMEPGDSWCVPGGVPHRAEVLEDSVVIEVFSPPRKEYL